MSLGLNRVVHLLLLLCEKVALSSTVKQTQEDPVAWCDVMLWLHFKLISNSSMLDKLFLKQKHTN